METTSELIQRRLKELNITKSDLAKKAGVSRAYIGDLANGTAKTKNGSYRPSPDILARLVKALEITETEFFASLGYAPENSSKTKTPTNVAEFFEILEDLGLDVQFSGGIKMLETLDEDDLQELLDGIVANASAKVKRKMQAKLNG